MGGVLGQHAPFEGGVFCKPRQTGVAPVLGLWEEMGLCRGPWFIRRLCNPLTQHQDPCETGAEGRGWGGGEL